MKKISGTMFALVLLVTMSGATADSKVEEKKVEAAPAPTAVEKEAAKVVNKECEAPDWAKAIGHEEKWKLHNGCKGQ